MNLKASAILQRSRLLVCIMYVVNLTVAVGTKVDAFILLLFVELESVAAEDAVYRLRQQLLGHLHIIMVNLLGRFLSNRLGLWFGFRFHFFSFVIAAAEPAAHRTQYAAAGAGFFSVVKMVNFLFAVGTKINSGTLLFSVQLDTRQRAHRT